jgi:hypothetical protein
MCLLSGAFGKLLTACLSCVRIDQHYLNCICASYKNNSWMWIADWLRDHEGSFTCPCILSRTRWKTHPAVSRSKKRACNVYTQLNTQYSVLLIKSCMLSCTANISNIFNAWQVMPIRFSGNNFMCLRFAVSKEWKVSFHANIDERIHFWSGFPWVPFRCSSRPGLSWKGLSHQIEVWYLRAAPKGRIWKMTSESRSSP